MPRPLVNLDELTQTRTTQHGERFGATLYPISTLLGAKKLGYNLTVVPPGKRAFPYHCHHANEELFFVLAGQGELRFGDQTYPVRAGDLIGCPPGGPEHAHQLINTGAEELRYLSVSTTLDTDIFQYPDSGKFGAVGGRLPGTRPHEATFSGFYDEASRKDYWDGEQG